MYWSNLGAWQHLSTSHTLGVERVKGANSRVPRCSLHTFAQATRGEGLPRSERPLKVEGVVHIKFSCPRLIDFLCIKNVNIFFQ